MTETQNKKIIIIEDEIFTAMFLRHVISSLGHDVVDIISSGEDAVNIIREKNPDLLIVDIMLDGDVDGIEVVERIKNEMNIPILYATANSDKATKSRAQKTNPLGFLDKPVNVMNLCSEINNIFSKGE